MRAPLMIIAAFIGALVLAAGCGGAEDPPSPDQGVMSTQIAAELHPGTQPPVALPPADPASPTKLRGFPPPVADAAP